MPTHKDRPVLSPDGHPRSAQAEAKLNAMVAATFATGAGKECLAYLRSITQNTIVTPEHSDAHLRHTEGMRSLVAIIMQRMELNRNAAKSD